MSRILWCWICIWLLCVNCFYSAFDGFSDMSCETEVRFSCLINTIHFTYSKRSLKVQSKMSKNNFECDDTSTQKRARAHTFAGWLDVQVLECVQMLFLFVTKVSYCYKNYQIVIHCARYVMAIVYEYDMCLLLMVLTHAPSLSLSLRMILHHIVHWLFIPFGLVSFFRSDSPYVVNWYKLRY